MITVQAVVMISTWLRACNLYVALVRNLRKVIQSLFILLLLSIWLLQSLHHVVILLHIKRTVYMNGLKVLARLDVIEMWIEDY